MRNKSFKEIEKETMGVIDEFKRREKKEWTPEAMVVELAKQLGEVSKQIMMLEGNYIPERDNFPKYSFSKAKLGDELSDILFMIMRISNHYGISLEDAHLKELKLAEEWFRKNK